MNPIDQPTRPWWRKKRWLAAGLLWLVFGYLLSEGPAYYAVVRGWLPLRPVSAIYRPARLIVGRTPFLADVREAYREWWNGLGSRDRTRVSGVGGQNWEIVISSDVDQGSNVLTTRPDGDTFAARFDGKEVVVENGRRTLDGGFAWNGPITFDGQPVATLPAGTRRLSIKYFDGELAIAADGRSISVEE